VKAGTEACDNRADIRPSDSPSAIAERHCSFRETRWNPYVLRHAMGAGVIECDVAFTSDRQLVCRHAQDDLALPRPIMSQVPELECQMQPGPLVPADPKTGREAQA